MKNFWGKNFKEMTPFLVPLPFVLGNDIDVDDDDDDDDDDNDDNDETTKRRRR